MPRARLDPIAMLPRGLSPEEAARYIGIGLTKFEEMVARGQMPRPKRIGTRTIYDRYAVDAAFTDLPEERGNAIDDLLNRQAKRA